jgi:hypothetical protein
MKSAQEEQQLPGDRPGCRLGGAHHKAPGEPFGGVGEGGLASFCYLRNSVCKYVRNSGEFQVNFTLKIPRNSAEFRMFFKKFRIPPEVKNALPWTA